MVAERGCVRAFRNVASVHIWFREFSALALLVCCALACRPREAPRPDPPPDPPIELPPLPPEKVYAPEPAPPPPPDLRADGRTITEAFVEDDGYETSDPLEVRRLVYRVTLRVPRSLGVRDHSIPIPASELYLDVSRDRLRARFAGSGWPVVAGSEVRLRRDQPGVYVFDGKGGRPLGPGQLAQWFEGGRLRFEPRLRVVAPPREEQSGPGDLICRLIAEWTNTSPDQLARKCGAGGAPPSLRVGVWRAERTADVAVRLPRSAMRADHRDPPPAIPDGDGRAFLSPELMARLPKKRGPAPEPHDDAPGEGLIVMNRGRATMMITVGGNPVGWVEAGATVHFVGIRPGGYNVGAMRAFGLQTATLRPVRVPGRIGLPR